MTEWFRPIEGYPLYNISNKGRVVIENSWTFITPTQDVFGEIVVRLVNHRFNIERLSPLIYKAFIGDIPENLDVQYIDGNSRNCQLDNLGLASKKSRVSFIKEVRNNSIRPSNKSHPVKILETGQEFVSIAEVRRLLKITQYEVTKSIVEQKKSKHGMTFVRI